MHLKHLTIQGFKTFATRTEFAFIPGITAVVGPNGSGKSNIADAVRWVLGEQSLRPLRIKRTEDVIFAGSSSRARQGLAEVTLTVDNSDGRLPLEFAEVTITRRAYRSGESEYRINNNKVRLRDIQELLGQGQVGQSTYTVIGQGMIDEVLSLRPDQRRELFEEAAGIGLYQRKRREATNRLQATEGNILRVNDIINELGPRLQRLQRQAQRAQEHAALVGELQELLGLWYGQRWEEGQKAQVQAQAQQEEARAQLKIGRRQLDNLEQQADELRTRQLALRESLGRWHRQSSDLHTQAEAQQRDLAVWAERLAALHRQHEIILTDLPALLTTQEDVQRRLAEAQAEQEQLGAQETEGQARLNASQVRWDQHQQQRAVLEEELTAAQDTALRQATTAAQARQALAQIQERRQEQRAQNRQWQDAAKQARAASTASARQIEALTGQVQALDERAQSLAEQQTQRDEQIRQITTHIDTLVTQIQALERQRHGWAERLSVLQDLQDSHAGYYDGVRAVLQAQQPGVLGTAASLMVVPAELETAIEVAMGARLQDLVVETWADAERAIGRLRDRQAGRATFLPLDTLRTRPAQGDPARLPGILGLASELISFDPRHASAFDHLLGRTLIAQDLPAARRALDALRQPNAPVQGVSQIVTLAGDVVRLSGAVSGGTNRRQNEGGLLARERELRDLPGRIATLDQQLEAHQRDLAAGQHQREDLQTQATDLAREIQDIAAERVTLQARSAEERRSAERLTQEATGYQERIAQLVTDLAALDTRETDLRAQAQAAQERQEASNALVDTLRRQIREWGAEQDLTADLTAARADLAVLHERSQQVAQQIQDLQTTIRRQNDQIAGQQAQAQHLTDQAAALQTDIDGVATARAALLQQLAELGAHIEPAEAALRDQEAQRDRLVTDTATARRALLQLETNASRAELEVRRCQESLEALRRQIEADLGELELSDDDLPRQLVLRFEDATVLALTDAPVLDGKALEARISTLRRQIKAAGAVNPEAPAEYDEALSRYTFLSTQAEDLKEASKSLQAVIAELDEVMQREFDRTFQAVAQEFRRYFIQLFGGGTARLTLIDAQDGQDAGVDIVARPPGKREQGLALLSGGERTLTAIALLFAILTVNPTPFCVLDEVDAALDEPNARRFRAALQEIINDTQFIIITHNRVTMESANTLYGVSMGEDSVSRVLSLKLEQVTDADLGVSA